MKEMELRKHATCSMCSKPIGHSRAPMFYRVTIEQFVLDKAAISRHAGLTNLLGGNAFIAHHMGPNEDLANFSASATITICMTCALERPVPTAVMAEYGQDDKASD